MRIIKLGTSEFGERDEVVEFFENDLPAREPAGRFQIPPGWIAEDKLHEGEPLLISHLGEVMYSARAGTELLDNDDEYRRDYPKYFCVDMTTVLPMHLSLKVLERLLRKRGRRKSIVRSHGWPTIPDTRQTDDLFENLRRE